MQPQEYNCKCGENNWIITKRPYCHNCPDNLRNSTQVIDDGECQRGPAWEVGCWILTCKQCGLEDYLPFMDTPVEGR